MSAVEATCYYRVSRIDGWQDRKASFGTCSRLSRLGAKSVALRIRRTDRHAAAEDASEFAIARRIQRALVIVAPGPSGTRDFRETRVGCAGKVACIRPWADESSCPRILRDVTASFGAEVIGNGGRLDSVNLGHPSPYPKDSGGRALGNSPRGRGRGARTRAKTSGLGRGWSGTSSAREASRGRGQARLRVSAGGHRRVGGRFGPPATQRLLRRKPHHGRIEVNEGRLGDVGASQ